MQCHSDARAPSVLPWLAAALLVVASVLPEACSSTTQGGTSGAPGGSGGSLATTGSTGQPGGTGGGVGGTGGGTGAGGTSGDIVRRCAGLIWVCGDGIDNDGDGLVDADDPE